MGERLDKQERARLEAEARADARKPDANNHTVYTDGLGVLGVGSWPDGPAAIKNAAYRDERRRMGEA